MFSLFTFLMAAASSFADTSYCNFETPPPDQTAHIGIYIQDVAQQQPLIELRSQEFFTPASTVKILTGIAALVSLREGFKFTTKLYGYRQHSTSNNDTQDMVLRLNADPMLTYHDLKNLLQQLPTLHGINHIKGRLIIDDQVFDNVEYGPGWMLEDMGWYFNPPVNSVILDRNTFSVTLKPNNHHVTLKVDAPIPMSVNHQVLIDRQQVLHITMHFDEKNHYNFQGILGEKPDKSRLAIINTRQYFKRALHQILNELNIKLEGTIQFTREKVNYNHLTTYAIHKSSPLLDLVQEIQFTSDNLIADVLFKTMGAKYSHQLGSWQHGKKALVQALEPYIKTPYEIVDGSGLSRYNLLAPEQMGQLLYQIYHSNFREPVLRMLPNLGKDGSTTRTFGEWYTKHKKAPWLQEIKMKKGTMTGASCLAGFIKTNDRTFVVVIMVNNFIGSVKSWQHWKISWLENFFKHLTQDEQISKN